MDRPTRLHWLDPLTPDQPFPAVHLAMREPNGLLAIGGDLSVSRLIRAYRQGIFPWYNPDEPILWWCPDPRAVLPPTQLRVSRSLRKAIQRADYAVTLDRAFSQVLDACAQPRRGSRGTWLGQPMQQAYAQFHQSGHAHSIEVWRQAKLIGGLYGVVSGRVFFGESMFSQATDASKIALYWLCQELIERQFALIDCQIASDHLASLGARQCSRVEFLQQLASTFASPCEPGRWQFQIPVPCAPAHAPLP
ncbi:leucyl/phenylalanyl-tRNA--protein transferase [Sinimarinibacterium sp. NLF-5-8]|uniref:leucyl/phenylalanyl-tRNA--protein transferase n=1 Tax=Sinimarinibacterium sp. NLF-5-8 TaxID=2698684 RepID=UPI00137BE92F|nr:leucyl/phenylalanyl-tRNA--protein transferase [Sinimarinibacterium sp. NLF-5-8]QHS09449.1 leucyl/phenylalanyl-tRNA--protein transferase [Sinimarinibacterium sp. NLF-5-8]